VGLVAVAERGNENREDGDVSVSPPPFPRAVHDAERWRNHPSLEIVRTCFLPADVSLEDSLSRAAATPSRSLPSRLPLELFGTVTSTLDELLADERLDVVVASGGEGKWRAEIAERALSVGHHVAMDAPACLTVERLDRLLALAERSGRILFERSAGWGDGRFRRALDVVREGHVGRVVSARISIAAAGLSLRPGGLVGPSGLPCSSPRELLRQRGAPLFRQLALLIPVEPVSVIVRTQPPPFRFEESDRALTAASFLIVVDFAGGELATLEVSEASYTHSNSGWQLRGTRGGYEQERLYLLATDGEIGDQAVDVMTTELLDPYARDDGELLRRLELHSEDSSSGQHVARAEDDRMFETTAWRRATRLLELALEQAARPVRG